MMVMAAEDGSPGDVNGPAGTCEFIDRCPLFELFSLPGALNSYKINYCTSDFQRCARYQRALAGVKPAQNLLPCGKLLNRRPIRR